MPACRQKLDVFGLNGTGYYKVQSLKASRKIDTLADGSTAEKYVYTWVAKDRTPALYYLGPSLRSYLPVVVGGDPFINITAECRKINSATVSGSQLNQRYGQMRAALAQNNKEFSQLSKTLREAKRDKNQPEIDRAVAAFKASDAKKMQLLDSLRNIEPFLGRIASLSTYTSFPGEVDTPYKNEAEHYVNTFWKHVDFKDRSYDNMNAVYEASLGYASTLSRVVDPEKAGQILNRLFDKWPAGSKARLFSMGGAFNGLNQANNAAALTVAERLVAEYKESDPAAVATVEKSFSKLTTSLPGAQAPNLVGPSPEGETIDLKDLRGKVVLVDFWASWCGPCRKENPRVKRLYDQYASKGFEVLGVSLDRTKDRWVQAIEKDGLTWLHISDLKHWKSAYAALYGVRSIPDTVLLDAEGKIIARGLRGTQLEAKLAQIFNGK